MYLHKQNWAPFVYYYYQFKFPEAFLTSKPMGGFPLTGGWVSICKPCLFQKYHSLVSVYFIILMDICVLPYFFAITRSLPKHIKVFQISMEKTILHNQQLWGTIAL